MSDSGGGSRPTTGQGNSGPRRRRRRRRGGQRTRREDSRQLDVEAGALAEAATEDDQLAPSSQTEEGPSGEGGGARCPICGLVIRILYSAITEQESQQPAHFDCVLRQLSAAEELGEGERLAYLGAGSFGVIQLRRRPRTRARGRRSSGSPSPLFVRKRIEYEDPEPVPEWRESLALRAAGTVFVEMGTEQPEEATNVATATEVAPPTEVSSAIDVASEHSIDQ